MGFLGSNGLFTHREIDIYQFFISFEKNAGSAGDNSGNLSTNDGEVTGKLMKQREEGKRHSVGPRNLVLCSAMEMKEEGDGIWSARAPTKDNPRHGLFGDGSHGVDFALDATYLG